MKLNFNIYNTCSHCNYVLLVVLSLNPPFVGTLHNTITHTAKDSTQILHGDTGSWASRRCC